VLLQVRFQARACQEPFYIKDALLRALSLAHSETGQVQRNLKQGIGSNKTASLRGALITYSIYLKLMVSTAYTRGRSREYRVLQTLREDGWLCSRSAASHGPVDIFGGKDGRTLLIQVKSGKGRMSALDMRVLKEWAEAYSGRAEVWHFHKRKGLKKTLVHDATHR